jgi:hypothetical protein
MLSVIHCESGCGGTSLNFNIEIGLPFKQCKRCFHVEKLNWKYYFCNYACFQKWVVTKSVDTKGLPCKRCAASGTYKSEACYVCDGQGVVFI